MNLGNRRNEERRGGGRRSGIGNVSMDGEGRADKESRCGICKFVTKDGEHALCCELCNTWYHAGCHKVPVAHYKVLEHREYVWVCKVCKPKFKKTLQSIDDLECKYNEVIEENEKLKDEICNWQEKFQAMKGEIVDETLSMVRDTVMNEIQSKVEEKYQEREEKYREREEKERKKNNLVMYNLKESIAETAEERKKDDEQKCQHILAEAKTEQATVVNVIRMGKKQQGRTRPLLVKLENSNMKYDILKNAKNLKTTQQEWIKKVSITRDMTVREREESKRLYEQLKQKRNNGEEGWYIRDGRLLQSNVRQA